MNKSDRIIRCFIVGASRSGTTLLQSIVASHPDLVSVPETGIVFDSVGDFDRRLFNIRRRGIKGWLRDSAAATRISAGIRSRVDLRKRFSTLEASLGLEEIGTVGRYRTTLKSVFRRFEETMDAGVSRSSAKGWVEKTPSHLHYIDVIKRFMPSAMFIHMIRPVADNAASIYDLALKHPELHWGRYRNMNILVRRMTQCVNAHDMWTHDDKHLFVDFQDITGNTRMTAERIVQFLGLEFDSAMVGRDSGQSVIPDVPWQAATRGPIDAQRGSKFGKVFNTEQQEYLCERLPEFSANVYAAIARDRSRLE